MPTRNKKRQNIGPKTEAPPSSLPPKASSSDFLGDLQRDVVLANRRERERALQTNTSFEMAKEYAKTAEYAADLTMNNMALGEADVEELRTITEVLARLVREYRSDINALSEQYNAAANPDQPQQYRLPSNKMEIKKTALDFIQSLEEKIYPYEDMLRRCQLKSAYWRMAQSFSNADFLFLAIINPREPTPAELAKYRFAMYQFLADYDRECERIFCDRHDALSESIRDEETYKAFKPMTEMAISMRKFELRNLGNNCENFEQIVIASHEMAKQSKMICSYFDHLQKQLEIHSAANGKLAASGENDEAANEKSFLQDSKNFYQLSFINHELLRQGVFTSKLLQTGSQPALEAEIADVIDAMYGMGRILSNFCLHYSALVSQVSDHDRERLNPPATHQYVAFRLLANELGKLAEKYIGCAGVADDPEQKATLEQLAKQIQALQACAESSFAELAITPVSKDESASICEQYGLLGIEERQEPSNLSGEINQLSIGDDPEQQDEDISDSATDPIVQDTKKSPLKKKIQALKKRAEKAFPEAEKIRMEQLENSTQVRERHGQDVIFYVRQAIRQAQRAANLFCEMARAYNDAGAAEEKRQMTVIQQQLLSKVARYEDNLPRWRIEVAKSSLDKAPCDSGVSRLLELDSGAFLKVESTLLDEPSVAVWIDDGGKVWTLTNRDGDVLLDYVVEHMVTFAGANTREQRQISHHAHYHVPRNQQGVTKEWLEAESAKPGNDKKAKLVVSNWKTGEQARLGSKRAKALGIDVHHGAASLQMLRQVQEAVANNLSVRNARRTARRR